MKATTFNKDSEGRSNGHIETMEGLKTQGLGMFP